MNEKKRWKPVTIGGFTGILMGAGTMYLYQTHASSETTGNTTSVEKQIVDVPEPSEDLSFGQAFEAARAELGPGGVFRWHGNVYNTYTVEEWNAMSHHEQQQFVARMEPEVTVDEIDTQQMGYAARHEEDVAVNQQNLVGGNDDVKESPEMPDEDVVVATPDSQPDSGDDDVRIVGQERLMAPNGQYIGVEEVEHNGRRVTIIDVDNDGYGDYAMSDLNQNGRPDEGEVIDLHTGEIVAFDQERTSAPEEDVAMAEEQDNGFVATDETPTQDDGADMMYSL